MFVSSFFGGNPRKIIDLWKTGSIRLCLSSTIVDEYIEVLKRIGLQEEKEIEELLGIFAEGYNILFSAETPKLDIIKAGPDDNKFIECAVALKCPHIITGNKHYKNIKNYMGIKIVTPAEFISEYEKSEKFSRRFVQHQLLSA